MRRNTRKREQSKNDSHVVEFMKELAYLCSMCKEIGLWWLFQLSGLATRTHIQLLVPHRIGSNALSKVVGGMQVK